MKKTLMIVGMILALTSCNFLDDVADNEYGDSPAVNYPNGNTDGDDVACAEGDVACNAVPPAPAAAPVAEPVAEPVRMANPASDFCTDVGGTPEVSDTQMGICKFSNGVECEEWMLYSGGCEGKKFKPEGDINSPSYVYCEKNGGTLEDDAENETVKNCIFEDESYCTADEFMGGICHMGEAEDVKEARKKEQAKMLKEMEEMEAKMRKDMKDMERAQVADPNVNPMAKYCIDEKGTIEVVESDEGMISGLCTFDDETQCDTQVLYSGGCDGHEGFQAETPAVVPTTPAAEEVPAVVPTEEVPVVEAPVVIEEIPAVVPAEPVVIEATIE